MAAILVTATPVSANVSIENGMAVGYVAGPPGIEAYAYGTGVDHLFTTDADFASGTIIGPASVSSNAVVIDSVPADEWWDLAWQRRQCFTVSADTSLAQYPVRVVVDTTGLPSDDLRVVPVSVPASLATPLVSYVEPAVGTAETAVWFQAPIGTATDYCVYFDSGAASTSDQFAPFTYSGGQTVRYYTMTNSYNGNGVNSRVQAISYVDGNIVSDGTTTVTLDEGDTHVFSGMDRDSFVTATGPIDASYDRSNRESLIPESFAADTLVFPTNRYSERFWIRSPFATTTIEAVVDGTVIATATVGPGDGSVQMTANVNNPDFVVLRSTDGTDFLATHRATNGGDIVHGVPWFGDPLIGVASTRLNVGSVPTQNVDYVASNGASGSLAASPAVVATIGSNGSRGNGRAYRLTATGQFHAIQQADANGRESTSFLPTRLLSQTFRVPINHRYIAIACPEPSTTVTIDGSPLSCDTGAAIGHLRPALGVFSAGALIEADHPIFVYYETVSGSDEHNIYGAKGAIPYVRNPTVVAGPVETQTISACIVWTSPIFATADVFGLTSIDVDGTFTYRISFDGGAFIGPDGTPASSFVGGGYIPYEVDDSTTAQIEVEFCGDSGDELRLAGFECELVEVVEATPVVSVGGDGPVLRVYPASVGSGSWVEYVASTGADSYLVSTDVNGLHLEAVAGVISNPAPAFAPQPYSVLLTGVSPQVSQLSVNLIEEGPVRLEVPVDFDISS